MTDNSTLQYYYQRLDLLAQQDKRLSVGKVQHELLKIHKLFQELFPNLSERKVKQDYIERVIMMEKENDF